MRTAGRIRRRPPARLGTSWSSCSATGRGFRKLPPASIARAAAIYRAVSSDLMRAEAAGYSPDVIALLDGLAGARAQHAVQRAALPAARRAGS